MNRRDALQQLGALALLASPVGLALSHTHTGENFKVLKPAVPGNVADKIEVLEFFHYTCNHCRDFEPLLKQWVKRVPSDVAFSQVPAVWSKATNEDFGGRLYFTLLAMKRFDLHEKVFDDVQSKKLTPRKPNFMREWAAANKLDVPTFMGIYDSFGVNTQVQQAHRLLKLYRIDSVPTMAVGGRFLTSAEMAGSFEAMLKVVDSLIERLRKGE